MVSIYGSEPVENKYESSWLEALYYSNNHMNVFHMIVQKSLIDQPFLLMHGKVVFKESCKRFLGANPNIIDGKLTPLSNTTRICNIYYMQQLYYKLVIINFYANLMGWIMHRCFLTSGWMEIQFQIYNIFM